MVYHPPGIVVEIVGTARVRNIQLTVASCWRKMRWRHIFSITILIPTLPQYVAGVFSYLTQKIHLKGFRLSHRGTLAGA